MAFRRRGEPYSMWHKINHLYEERFDPRRHLETGRAHLDRNWRYGKPLVEDAMARGDYREADSGLERTFAAYLGRTGRANGRTKTPLHFRHLQLLRLLVRPMRLLPLITSRPPAGSETCLRWSPGTTC